MKSSSRASPQSGPVGKAQRRMILAKCMSLPPTLIVTSRVAGSRGGIWLSRTVSVVAP